MKAFIALILASFMVSVLLFAPSVKAQEPLNTTIKPDGSVGPSTSLLERNGNKYTFKGDIYGTIWVQTDNIIIDGAGYTLEGYGDREDIYLIGPSTPPPRCINVLVENLRLHNGVISTAGGRNNSFIGNYFDNSIIEMQFGANGTGNVVKHNTFKEGSIFYDYNYYGTEVITENNFIDSSILIGLAISPIADKNYWSDYTAKYPDAKVLGNSGTWDTPYVGETFDMKQCIDNHPLVNPVTDFVVADFSNPNLTTAPTSTPTVVPSSTLNVPEFPISTILLLLSLIVATSISSIYFQKQTQRNPERS
jgi:hypothetical protein